MSECGVTEFMRGGTITEANVVASNISQSNITASVIASSQLQTLASVDDASARVIADAIAQLSPEALSALAKAIAAAQAASVGTAPKLSTEESLPLAVAGARDSLLGRPDTWLASGAFVMPAYKAG